MMYLRSRPAMLAGVVVAAAFLGLAPLPAAAQQMQMMAPGQAELIHNLLPTVVNITAFITDTSATGSVNAGTSAAKPAGGRPNVVRGSGFVIEPNGVILTNYHVVQGAYDIHVMLSDGTLLPGRILASTPAIDLALVKVSTQQKLTAVHWADSDNVQIGDPVFAIGNALGVGLTVTSGIVSALNRNIMDTPYDDFIQTDAAINHGNSGGPLFNRSGDVIGVDSAIISPTTGSVGLGFALPANDARRVADRMLRYGNLTPAYIGVKVEQVTPDMAVALGMPKALGSIVAMVSPGHPAAVAGVQVGDVILTFDNQTPSDERALLRDMAKSTVGQTVAMTVLRAGKELTLHVTPVAWPASGTMSSTGAAQKPPMLVPANLGLSLSALTADLRARNGLMMQQVGVLIDGVAAGTDAFDRGLVPGDVILRVQETDVKSPQQVQAAIDAARAQHKEYVLVLVVPKKEQKPGPTWMALRVSE